LSAKGAEEGSQGASEARSPWIIGKNDPSPEEGDRIMLQNVIIIVPGRASRTFSARTLSDGATRGCAASPFTHGYHLSRLRRWLIISIPRVRCFAVISLVAVVAALCLPQVTGAKSDGFNDAVKMIEQFYHVKHQSIPLLARAGMKAARTAAQIKGGDYKRLAEAGSVRVAFFEDQNFDSRGQIATFKASMQTTLEREWSPLVQTLTPKDEEQTYIYLRDDGGKFHLLVVTIERHEATVVEATVAPGVLAQLMKDPNEMGKALTDDATINDN
jgi:hypothetical protein